jgi:hypothetical protein
MNLQIIISNNRENAATFLHLAQDGAVPVGEPLTVRWCTKDGELIRSTAAQAIQRFCYSNLADLSQGLLILWMGTPSAPTYLDELAAWLRSEGADPLKPLSFYVMAQNL